VCGRTVEKIARVIEGSTMSTDKEFEANLKEETIKGFKARVENAPLLGMLPSRRESPA
jgi:hypothetical protein